MQRGQDPLYSSWKQSIWKHFSQEPGHLHWVDWESMSEFDTDCDAQADLVTRSLQTRVEALQALQGQQLLGETIAQTVAQVVLPVVATMPDPRVVAMDMNAPSGDRPESTMGPGQLVMSPDMPLVFDDDDEQRQ